MIKEKRWEILSKLKIKSEKLKIENIITVLLENRGLKTEKEVESFLHGDLSSVAPETVGIDAKNLVKAIKRIQKAIEKKEQIVVFGDYDVDGITGTAIVWETLHALGAAVVPYIPNRIDEGYGLSIKGIENLTTQVTNTTLIITVDNGIVAHEAVDFANKKGIDVIITDHHTPPQPKADEPMSQALPLAYAIVHTTALCGAGVGYLLAQSIAHNAKNIGEEIRSKLLALRHLELVALATIADLVPLTRANRVLLKFGLAELHNTRRPGLLGLFEEAKIEPETIGVYEIGHIIAPRLNAMGRLESAMDSLRLLCTKDKLRAKVLADTLQRINKERQLLTQSAAMHAIERIKNQELRIKKKLLFIAHDEYEEGIIGLVAGKLVEEFYLPAIVLSKGETMSKASARSIAGLNIIEFIRSSSQLLVNAGGHPMAAGFTVETKNITALQEFLEKLAEELVVGEMLQRILRIDCKLPLEIVNQEFYMKLQNLGPFGMGNPEPTFVSKVVVQDVKTVGVEKKHLKLRVAPQSPVSDRQSLEAIGFGLGDRADSLKIGQEIEIVYTISENEWNGRVNLQLKIKDIK